MFFFCHTLRSCLPTLFLYFFFTFCDVTDDVKGVLLRHHRFLSITSDWDWESRERHNCDGTELPNRLICALPPRLKHDLRGCELTLTSTSTLKLTFIKQKVYYSPWLDERIAMVIECCLCHSLRPLLAEFWAKNQTSTFASLTWPLRSRVDLRP